MVKFGKRFASALAELSSLRTEVADWACIDYGYHKTVLFRIVQTTEGSKPPILVRSEITGEEPVTEGAGEDDNFRRSLLNDLADVDDCFEEQCQLIRLLFEDDANTELHVEGRQLLAVLNRWCVLNYLAVLKIVKYAAHTATHLQPSVSCVS